jgi:hypothetical protein
VEIVTTLHFIPFVKETREFTAGGDFALEPILHSIPVTVRMPVIKMPRSAKGRYSDSELASAAVMLEKLRKGADVSKPVSVEDQVLDVVVDRLIGELQ